MDALRRAEQARVAKAAEEVAAKERTLHAGSQEEAASKEETTGAQGDARAADNRIENDRTQARASLGGSTDEGGLSDTGIDLSSDSDDHFAADPPTLDELASPDQLFLEPMAGDPSDSPSQSTGTWPSTADTGDDAATRDFLLGGDTGATLPSYRSVRGDLDDYFENSQDTSPSLGDDTLGSATSSDATLGDLTRPRSGADPGLSVDTVTGALGAGGAMAASAGGAGATTWGATTARSQAHPRGDTGTGGAIDTGGSFPDFSTGDPVAAGALFVPRRPGRRSRSWMTMGFVSTLVLGVFAAGGYAYWDDLVRSFVKGPTLVVNRSPQSPTRAAPGGNTDRSTRTSAPPRDAGTASGTGGGGARSTAAGGSGDGAASAEAGTASASAIAEAARQAENDAFTRQSVAIGSLIAAGSRSRPAAAAPDPATADRPQRSASTARAPADRTGESQVAGSEAFTPPFPPVSPRVSVGRAGAGAQGAGVRISRRAKPSRVNPYVSRGYEAYQQGNLEAARAAYGEALRTEPSNRDALLGLAAVALREGRPREAAGGYHTLLKLNPRDEAARAGLMAVEAAGDPAGREGQVREMLRSAPDSAALHANLGGLYSQQGRWPEAQQAYFDAFRLDSENADNAYNLAVSLDQLAQGKAALNYYRQALELSDRAGARFDTAAVASRISALAAQ